MKPLTPRELYVGMPVYVDIIDDTIDRGLIVCEIEKIVEDNDNMVVYYGSHGSYITLKPDEVCARLHFYFRGSGCPGQPFFVA